MHKNVTQRVDIKYFFMDVGNKAICLIYQNSVAVFKENNLKTLSVYHEDYGENLSQVELNWSGV